ncbi:Glycosyl hydrolase, family 13, catalytic domain [Ostreococcus tauri]|uniref:isoamylase n=1 Tax=Ostreococcus tauri TaxID=70448 RepID=Q6PYZ2_OSTTA|nr:Glycosyl hydrolase, family 13, catalytic domain [Ostreococcus tauri]AAS88884.1 DBEI [Ostreococcus tauri]CAL57001.1 Glycosyl hydrolase, family 13, catalytic domain [Ostreococcus tauri]|eukprot:XP_003083046.1 Glycosyl hydrolase, family 13, catalytic domain [Ostreococcus tauri]
MATRAIASARSRAPARAREGTSLARARRWTRSPHRGVSGRRSRATRWTLDAVSTEDAEGWRRETSKAKETRPTRTTVADAGRGVDDVHARTRVAREAKRRTAPRGVPGVCDTPRRGDASALGATRVVGCPDDTVNFAVYTSAATAVSLVLWTPEGLARGEIAGEIELDETTNKTGSVWHVALPRCAEDVLYGYRVDGPYEPEAGHRFDKSKILLDPYAKFTVSRPEYGVASKKEDGTEDCWPQYAGGVPKKLRSDGKEDFDWEGVTSPKRPMRDLVVYEAHARGLTADLETKAKPGTYAAIEEALPYLKQLGVNAIELMPCHEFNEMEYHSLNHVTGEFRRNFWGYSTVNFFSPMTRYAEAGADDCGREAAREFKRMIRECHRAGIEVIMDVVFNHTAEGNEQGLTLSFRGLDNRVYYMVAPEGQFYNYSGCGNTMNCNHPVVREFILECLRYWVLEYHIDGFRFDLASILTRASSMWDRANIFGEPTAETPMLEEVVIGTPLQDPPLIDAISNDPVLAGTKLIAEAWDAGGLYQVGSFPHYGVWSEWNGKFRDDVRNFIKGVDGYAGLFAERLCGSPNLYADRSPSASINFVTAHDGFTLRDCVSYNEKQNHANGEENRDGEEHNASWNCGLSCDDDGECWDPEIVALRDRQMRNFVVALFVAQGVPMMYMGDEYGHTKCGNNNTYCHDNALNWIDWSEASSPLAGDGLARFTKQVIALRKKHSAFRLDSFPSADNIQWHGHLPDTPMWDEESRFVAFTLQDKPETDKFYIAFNSHHEPAMLKLPSPPERCKWKLILDTSLESPFDVLSAEDIAEADSYTAEAMFLPGLRKNTYLCADRSAVIFRAVSLA